MHWKPNSVPKYATTKQSNLFQADQEVPEELRKMHERYDNMKERKEREKASFGIGGGGGGGRR